MIWCHGATAGIDVRLNTTRTSFAWHGIKIFKTKKFGMAGIDIDIKPIHVVSVTPE